VWRERVREREREREESRKKVVKCYIWSISLYGAETWTLRAVDLKHLMKCGAGQGWKRSV
jgi:hypothetical protein